MAKAKPTLLQLMAELQASYEAELIEQSTLLEKFVTHRPEWVIQPSKFLDGVYNVLDGHGEVAARYVPNASSSKDVVEDLAAAWSVELKYKKDFKALKSYGIPYGYTMGPIEDVLDKALKSKNLAKKANKLLLKAIELRAQADKLVEKAESMLESA